FLTPLAFAVLGVAAPLVLLYFLKVRRRERRVASLMLWGAELRDREASTFFQRLQRDPLLILQLLALVALALALARPVVTVTGEGARKVVVVLDTSASMKARDVSPSRFDAARSEAAPLGRRLGDGAVIMGRGARVGRRGYLVRLVCLAIRKTYYGSFGYQAFVSVVNHSPEAQTFDFALAIDGNPIAEKSLTLEPNVRRSIVLPFAHQGGGTV